jgi:hypothetical protein
VAEALKLELVEFTPLTLVELVAPDELVVLEGFVALEEFDWLDDPEPPPPPPQPANETAAIAATKITFLYIRMSHKKRAN